MTISFERVYIWNLTNKSMHQMQWQMLKTKLKGTKPSSIKPSKTSPPLAPIAEMGKSFRKPI
jgi:hypothetical protein